MNNIDYLRGYLAELAAAGRAKGTIELRKSHITRFLHHVKKDATLVQRQDIIDWLSRNHWKAEARRSARTSISQFFTYLHVNGIIYENPAYKIPPVRLPRTVPKPVPDVFVMEAMSKAPSDIQLAIEIMAIAGLRRAECAAIKASDVEPLLQGWGLRVMGKGAHVRVVPIPSVLAYKIRRKPGFVFPGRIDGHISPAWLGKQISRYLPKGYTPHKLRHRYATVAYEGSRNLRAVQELLGHASIATTQIYIKASAATVVDTAAAAWKICA